MQKITRNPPKNQNHYLYYVIWAPDATNHPQSSFESLYPKNFRGSPKVDLMSTLWGPGYPKIVQKNRVTLSFFWTIFNFPKLAKLAQKIGVLYAKKYTSLKKVHYCRAGSGGSDYYELCRKSQQNCLSCTIGVVGIGRRSRDGTWRAGEREIPL